MWRVAAQSTGEWHILVPETALSSPSFLSATSAPALVCTALYGLALQALENHLCSSSAETTNWDAQADKIRRKTSQLEMTDVAKLWNLCFQAAGLSRGDWVECLGL